MPGFQSFSDTVISCVIDRDVKFVHNFMHCHFLHFLINACFFSFFFFHPSKTVVQAAESSVFFFNFFSERMLLFLHNLKEKYSQ